jgi:GPH family glycoside/pentoside/hexuronide:cation symporter
MSGLASLANRLGLGPRPPSTAPAPPLRLWTMALYGLGSVSNGVKSRMLSTFLLIFYSEIMGVPAAWIGAAVMIALIFDGFIDPVIGQISDNFRSPWGRRHPFMYLAAIPYGIVFFLVWNPPEGWSAPALLAYMTISVMVLRSVDTFFEVPAAAMAPELTDNYHLRTTLISFRYFFTYGGGMLLTWVAYSFFFKETPENPDGLFDKDAYSSFALLAAVIMTVVILVSAAGTHHRIPWLKQPPQRRLTLGLAMREILETLANPALWLANAAGLFTAIATGFTGGLAIYFHVYFWELDPEKLSYLTIAGMAAAFLGIFLGPQITRRAGKRNGAILMFAALIVVSITPVALRLAGLLPPNGDPAILALIIAETVLTGSLTLMTTIAITSMIVDVAEDSELKTGRRSEGLLVSVDNILKKTVAGFGVFSASLIIGIADLPEKARPGNVPQESLDVMGMIYIPCIAAIYLCAIGSLFAFRLDEASHEENLRKLSERAREGGSAG